MQTGTYPGQLMKNIFSRGIILSVCFLIFSNVGDVLAQSVQQCVAPVRISPEILSQLDPIILPDGGRIEVSAEIVQRIDDILYMRGSVVIRDSERILVADEIEYDIENRTYQAMDHVVLFEGDLEVQAKRIWIDVGNETMIADKSRYFVYDSNEPNLLVQRNLLGQGGSEKLEVAEQIIYLMDSTFSNCESDVRDIEIAGRVIELNMRTRQGKAKRASIQVKGRNVLVLPTFLFPIGDERRSGYLFPVIGYSSKYGMITEIPYYFNLAPNYDATVGFNVFGRRGVMAESEFRHLGPNSETTVRGEYMPEDRHRDRKHLDSRYGAQFDSTWRDGTRYYSEIDVRWVSDVHYLNDYSRLFSDSDDLYLEQNAKFSAVGNHYIAQVGVQKFVTSSPNVVEANRTWERLPWARVEASVPLISDFRFGVKLSLDKFSHKTKLQGTRIRTDTGVEYRREGQGGEFSLAVGSESLQYSLSNTKPAEHKKREVSNTYFIADGRLFFDSYTGNDSRWTIEPRVQVSGTNRIRQSHLPVFDTVTAKFENYEDIFRTTPYLGGDRLRDVDKVSVGVSARLDDFSNPDLVRQVGIGRVYYSNDKIPSLEMDPDRKRKKSDLLFAMAIGDSKRDGRLGIVYDDEDNKVKQTYAKYSQELTPRTDVKGIYRFLEDDDEQLGAALETSLTTNWTMTGYHVESLERDRSLESSVQFEYISCCWSGGIVISQEKRGDKKRDTSISLTFRVEGFGVN